MAKNYITYMNEKTPKEHLDRSIKVYREVLQNCPDSVPHRLGLGVFLGWTGDVAGAKRELEIVMSSNDDKHRELAEKYLKHFTDQQDS